MSDVQPKTSYVSTREKIQYGIGGFVFNLLNNAVSRLTNPVLNMTLHINPTLISIAILLPRIWDAFSDPIVGQMSDNARTRWGRRKPFIIIGAIWSGLAMGIMWLLPDGFSHAQYFWWFLIFSLLYFTGATLFNVPYLALGKEMTPDYHERTSIAAYRMAAAKISGPINQGLPWFAALLAGAAGTMVTGARIIGLVCMVLIIVIGIISAFGGKERYFNIAKAEGKVPLSTALKETFKNRPFVILAITNLLFWVGIAMVDYLGSYINVYYIAGGDKTVGLGYQTAYGLAQHVIALIMIPVLTKLSKRYGKKSIVILGLVMVSWASFLKFFCYTPSVWQLQFVVALFMGPGQGCLNVVLQSMMADVCDYDEWKLHKRREGMYGAALSWLTKMGIALAVTINNILLDLTGFDAALGGNQSEGTMLGLRLAFTVVPIIACFIAYFVLRKYTLTEKQLGDIRVELEARRGTVE